MLDQDIVNAFTGPLASALCVYGAILACRHQLKRWIAVSQLLPPAEIADADGLVVPEPPLPPAVTGWRKLFTKHMLKQQGLFLFYMGVQAFMIFGLGRISSRLFLNAFWGTFIFVYTTFCVGIATTVLVPDAQKVEYERKSNASGLQLKTESTNPANPSSPNWRNHARTAVAISIALASLIASYYGYTFMQPIISAGVAILLIARSDAPRMTVRGAVKVLLCFEIGSPVATAIVMFGLQTFTSLDLDTPPNHPSRGVASPSRWVMTMFAFSLASLPVILPGVLPVTIPTTLPPFSAPITRAGFSALILTLGAYKVVREHAGAWQEDGTEVFVIFVTIPIVMAALAGEARRRGVFDEWWGYQEIWLPSKAEATAMLLEHAEQAPNEKHTDEDKVEEGL